VLNEAAVGKKKTSNFPWLCGVIKKNIARLGGQRNAPPPGSMWVKLNGKRRNVAHQHSSRGRGGGERKVFFLLFKFKYKTLQPDSIA
jgi:hypothetical protein